MPLSSKTLANKTLPIILLSILLGGTQPFSTLTAYGQESTAGANPATYLVQFQPDLPEAERNAWLASQGVELVSWLPQIGVAEVRTAGGGEMNLLAGAADGPVVYIEADAAVSGERIITDPAYNNPDQGYAQKKLGLSAAWDVTEGDASIVIAIVDTGINLTHSEFKDRLVAGYDFVNSDADPNDDHGHGTHIAGITAAAIDGAGTAGICPLCKLMPVKVLNSRNGGTWSLVAKGILYAVDNGARVINLSLGASVSSATLESAIAYAKEHEVVIVAASGNLGSEMAFYPAAAPYVIAVSGTDRNDVRWALSNYGDYIDVAAPAVSIYSAYYDLATSTGYAYMTGTSMATPFVSGLAALVLSRQPDLTGAEVTQMITDNAVDLGPCGKDKEYGYGRIDIYATLLAANDGVVPQDPPGGSETLVKLFLPAVQTAN